MECEILNKSTNEQGLKIQSHTVQHTQSLRANHYSTILLTSYEVGKGTRHTISSTLLWQVWEQKRLKAERLNLLTPPFSRHTRSLSLSTYKGKPQTNVDTNFWSRQD